MEEKKIMDLENRVKHLEDKNKELMDNFDFRVQTISFKLFEELFDDIMDGVIKSNEDLEI